MNDIQFISNDKDEDAFVIEENGQRIAEMAVGILGNEMTVYHTEVAARFEGQGIAKKLFDAMVDHARKNKLQVIVLCPYVLKQFRRNPEQYQDIWKKGRGR